MIETTPAPQERTWGERALAAIPILAVYLWLAVVAIALGVAHSTPTVFTDELKWSMISRSIAAHGVPALRGHHTSFQSLYAILIAPLWWIKSTATAYDAIKYVNALVMTASVFPAYALARRFVSRPAALAVAAATAAIPSIAYSEFLLPEVLAYPWSVLCAWLCVEALETRRPRRVLAAVVACLLAPVVRGQLVVVPAAFATAAIGLWWLGPGGRRLRARWNRGDAVAAAVLAIGIFVVGNRWFFHGVDAWRVTTETHKLWILHHAAWAFGALAIGIGVLPAVGGLVALVPRRGERLTARDRSLIALTVGYLFWFGLYTAVKAAYLQVEFSTRVTERNLIYVAPLLFLGTAIALERRRVRPAALLAAAGLVALLLVVTPYQLQFPYFEALGFSILSAANRGAYMGVATMQWSLLGVLGGSALVMLAAARLRHRLAYGALLAALAAVVVGWNLLGEVEAAIGNNRQASQYHDHLAQPPDWVDRATGGADVTYLGQQEHDVDGISLLQFWNRSIVKVWSIDGTAPGPGPTLTPNLVGANGTLSNAPRTPFLLADNGVDPVGTPIAAHGLTRLYPLDGPIRLENDAEGITGDGWMSTDAAFNQFETPGHRAGTAKIALARSFCGPAPVGHATVRVGRLVIGPDKQPALGKVWATEHVLVENCRTETLRVPVAKPPWRVEIHLTPTFKPSEHSDSSDARDLGAVPAVTFVR